MKPGSESAYIEGGISVRQYYAAKAMQALLSNPATDLSNLFDLPGTAFWIADRMIAVEQTKGE